MLRCRCCAGGQMLNHITPINYLLPNSACRIYYTLTLEPYHRDTLTSLSSTSGEERIGERAYAIIRNLTAHISTVRFSVAIIGMLRAPRKRQRRRSFRSPGKRKPVLQARGANFRYLGALVVNNCWLLRVYFHSIPGPSPNPRVKPHVDPTQIRWVQVRRSRPDLVAVSSPISAVFDVFFIGSHQCRTTVMVCAAY